MSSAGRQNRGWFCSPPPMMHCANPHNSTRCAMTTNPKSEIPEKSDSGNPTLPLMPLRNLVVFPHMILPLYVGRGKSVLALEAAMQKDRSIILAAQHQAQTDEP